MKNHISKLLIRSALCAIMLAGIGEMRAFDWQTVMSGLQIPHISWKTAIGSTIAAIAAVGISYKAYDWAQKREYAKFIEKYKEKHRDDYREALIQEHSRFFRDCKLGSNIPLDDIKKHVEAARKRYDDLCELCYAEWGIFPPLSYTIEDIAKVLKKSFRAKDAVLKEKDAVLKEYATYYDSFTLNPELPLLHMWNELTIARKRHKNLRKDYFNRYRRYPPAKYRLEKIKEKTEQLDENSKKRLLEEYHTHYPNAQSVDNYPARSLRWLIDRAKMIEDRSAEDSTAPRITDITEIFNGLAS